MASVFSLRINSAENLRWANPAAHDKDQFCAFERLPAQACLAFIHRLRIHPRQLVRALGDIGGRGCDCKVAGSRGMAGI
jgi:hypothetical protein